MRTLSDLEAFVLVAREHSFVRAGKGLAMTPSAVSKAVARLENALGVKLLVRTTRSVRLTEAGATFHERCTRVLRELSEAESELSSQHGEPRGRMRVELPWILGTRYGPAWLSGFCALHEKVQLDLSLSDHFADMVAERIDVALRIGTLVDSRLVARTLARTRFVLVASPSYLAVNGTPRTPRDLASHPCLLFRSSNTGTTLGWQLRNGSGTRSLHPSAAHTSTSSEVLARLAEHGLGIAQLLSISAAEGVARGTLVPVLEPYSTEGPALSLLSTKEQLTVPKVRAFVDYMVRTLRGVPPWERELAAGTHGAKRERQT